MIRLLYVMVMRYGRNNGYLGKALGSSESRRLRWVEGGGEGKSWRVNGSG